MIVLILSDFARGTIGLVLLVLLYFSIRLLTSGLKESQAAKLANRDQVFADPHAIIKYRFSEEALMEAVKDCTTSDDSVFVVQRKVATFLIPSVQRRIEAILEANPDADLKDYESALGIQIISQQKQSKKSTSRSGIYT